ncbi:hypothetical protein AB0442_39910 [Kitasatospora sp. NPDC085895]|uniref:hypothetical protein n=1 Tax=Kitasatospora sp. NPDC085895 TaxID=3155057 RepID=UPI003450C0F9
MTTEERRQDGPHTHTFRAWAHTVLDRETADGAQLQQRHVLDEAAHPETAAAFRRLAARA